MYALLSFSMLDFKIVLSQKATDVSSKHYCSKVQVIGRWHSSYVVPDDPFSDESSIFELLPDGTIDTGGYWEIVRGDEIINGKLFMMTDEHGVRYFKFNDVDCCTANEFLQPLDSSGEFHLNCLNR